LDPKVAPLNQNHAIYKHTFGTVYDLDHGHMSRSADGAWGATDTEAAFGSIDTFYSSNIVPQAVGLNQAKRKGAWGKLEETVLEHGCRENKEKICVINGPVFSDNDRIFNDYQVPTQFWKIVAYVSKERGLSAVGFITSHKEFLDQRAKATKRRVARPEGASLDNEAAVDYAEIGLDRVFQTSVAAIGEHIDINFGILATPRVDRFAGRPVPESAGLDSGRSKVINSLDDVVLS
jgi:hypothetical protein